MPAKRLRKDDDQSEPGIESMDSIEEQAAERSRFVWEPGDIEVYRDGKRIHPVPVECGCGCGAMTRGGEFLPGHDARLKSRLLAAARAGDTEARTQLLDRGWATGESIDSTPAKPTDAERAARRRAKLQAKAERLRAELADVEAQLTAAQG